MLKTRALGTESEREEAIINLKQRFNDRLVQEVLDRRILNNDTYETMSKPYLDYPDLLFITADFQEEAKERFEKQNMYSPLKGFDIGSIFALRQNIEEEKVIDPQTGKPKGSSWRSRYIFTGVNSAPVRIDAWKAFHNLENPRNIIALLTPPNPEQTFEDDAPGGTPLTQSEEDAKRGIEPSILGRINNLSKSNDSRFRLEENPTIMMFMPVGGAGSSIEHLLPAWASLLMSNIWWSTRYEIACVVGGGGLTDKPEEGIKGSPVIHLIDSSNTKMKLMELERSLHCRKDKKKGLIVLTGKMLSMGVSLPCTDVVILLNDGKSPDDIIQKMYRALTPSKGKTASFVVDLNPVRSLAAVYGYTRASHEGINSQTEILDIITDVYSWDADMYEINISSGKDARAPRPLDFQARMKLLLEQAESDPEYGMMEDIGGFETKMSSNIKRGIDTEFKRKLVGQFSSKKLETILGRIGLKEGSKISLQKGKLVVRVPKGGLQDEAGTETEPSENIEIVIENFIETVADFVKYLAITSSISTLEGALQEYEDNTSNVDGRSIQTNVLHMVRSRTIIKEGQDKELLSKLLIAAVKDFAFNSSSEVFRQMKGKIEDKSLRKDKVLDIIHKRLTPRQKQKKEAGEVFTPIELVEKLVAHLPKSVWKNPEMKWIDPANGIGNFPVVIFYKLDEGLKEWEPSEKRRRKHIIENMLYMIELQSNNSRVARRIFETLCEGCKPNILTGNTLEITPAKLKAKGFPEKYDIVMGNPPFQKGRNMMFYVYFIDFANKVIKDNGYLLYVIPNKILIPNKANEAIKNFNPLFIYHTVNKDFLPALISTTICAVICKKEAFDKQTKVKFDNGEMMVDLERPTPTQYNDIKLKEISDKILFGKDRKYLSISKEKPSKPHLYISRVWMRYSPDKPDGGGSHIFKISDAPGTGDDGSGKYIIIPDGITKSLLVWLLSRSETMRFITKIYAGAMNVPAFIWDIIPFIPIKSEEDSELYKLLHLDASDIKIIKEYLNDSVQADTVDTEEATEGGGEKQRNFTRKLRRT